MPLSLFSRRAVVAAAAASLAAPALAQAWPSRPVRLVAGFPAGGPSDLIARLTAAEFQKLWGQPVVVENRAGASGVVAAEAVARATPDGHTLLLTSNSLTLNPAVQPRVPYNAVRDFTPLAILASVPTILVVTPGLPVRKVADLVSLTKAEREATPYATSGTGSMGQFVGELFARMSGTKLLHVGYRGAAPAVQDLLAGNVKVSFLTLSSALSVIADGKLRAIATASTAPVPQLPEVPTFAQAGFEGILGDVWFGVMGPAGLPDAIVHRVSGDATAIVARPDIRSRLLEQASTPDGRGPAGMADQIREELPRWARVAREAEIRAE